jgi:Flp pilus assembly protein TadB
MLKYQMFNYNAIIYNVILQYEIFNFQNSRLALSAASQGSSGTSFVLPAGGTFPTSTQVGLYKTNFDKDVTVLEANLTQIIDKNINTPDNVKDTINEIVNIVDTNSETTGTFKKNQTALNESINKYNAQLENNNNLLYYYKVIIIIALFLVLVIFFIFTLNSIDNNTKIGIYIIMIIVAIILLVYYSNNFVVSEKFTITLDRANAGNGTPANNYIYTESSASLNYSTYKTALSNYNNKIIKIMASASVNKDMLFPIKVFSDKAATVRNNKAEYYKLKKINLDTGIEILKKSTNDYYYYMILIIVGIIILIFSLILLLLNPEMLIQVIAFAAICVIILIYYITYNTNRSTRLAENKNYWANFNPSKSTIDGL